MKKPSIIKRSYYFLQVLLIILYFFQSNIALSQQGNWDIGQYRMTVEQSSGPLKATMKGSLSLSSYEFVSSVGGVAFEGIAAPDVSLKADSLLLQYDCNRPDGKRLLIITKNDTVTASIPDWQLIPIAKYSNSEYNATVSIFGENISPTHFDIVYHPELENTLLGLRLLQADIQLMDLETFWELPKYNSNGKQEEILGLGEKEKKEKKSINKPESAIKAIRKALSNDSFQSWVLTDYNVEITFKFENGELELSGSPYYYFWFAENFELTSINKRNELVREINIYTEFIPVLKECECTDKIYEYTEKRENLKAKLDQMEPKVHEAKELSNRMKQVNSALYKYNPNVYGAATITMQYSAFFRYVKNTNPTNWTTFITSVCQVKIQPTIQTPTRWPKPSNRNY